MRQASNIDHQRLARRTPQEAGVSSAAIEAFLHAVERTGQELHSFMLVRDGAVIAEGDWAPYSGLRKRISNSISKSFTSAAIGMAVAEGRLSIEDPVISFFPDLVPAQQDDRLAAMQVQHLLTMSTGHDVDTVVPVLESGSDNWVEAFLALPLAHKPGTFFKYNTGASYMLSAILQQVTGEPLIDYLQPRLFEPLGIKDVTWAACPRGVTAGGWGLSLTTEEMARFGLLYLNQGQWQGQQLLSSDWVTASVSPQVSNSGDSRIDWSSGYGYQFWCNRYGTYRADGAFGQIILVMPNEGAVLAFTSSLSDLSQVLNEVWTHLLPALQAAKHGSTATEPDTEAATRLAQYVKSLQIALPTVESAGSEAYAGRTFALDANSLGLRALRLHAGAQGCSIVWASEQGEHVLEAGEEQWAAGDWPMAPELWMPEDKPNKADAAAVGRWRADGTYRIEIRLLDTAYRDELLCHFEDDRITITYIRKYSVTPLMVKPITGTLAQAGE